ncbi:zinc transporter ZIP12-like [Lytechinus pictus]|uniref:zinc transporter ZIP12-like n=1 Tax=Lytechinus pictus TaxID=7653 RepID=UPI0030BA2015
MMAAVRCCSCCVVCITLPLLLLPPLSVSAEEGFPRLRRQAHDHEHDHDLEESYFAGIGNYLVDEELTAERANCDFAENHNENITLTQVNILISTLFARAGCEHRWNDCSECSDNFVNDLFNALNVDPEYGLSEDVFKKAAPLLLYALYNFDALCAAGPGGTNLDEEVVYGKLMSADVSGTNSTFSEGDLEEILHSISEDYTATTQAKCFDATSVFSATVENHEAGASHCEVSAVSGNVISRMLEGYCIGEASLPSTDDFTDVVFDSYGTDGVIHKEEFNQLLSELGIGGSAEYNAGAVQTEAPVVIGDGDLNRRRRRNVLVAAVGYKHRVERSVGASSNNASSVNMNVSETCYTGAELLDIHGIDHGSGLTESQYMQLCPSLIQQTLSGVCSQNENQTPTSTITNAEIWIYGNLAVITISLLSVVGALFVPCMSGFVYECATQTMMALAVSTLTGDALMHLIPQAIGLHAHGHHNHAFQGPLNPELAYVWKCLVIELAIYFFFLLERFSAITGCGHSHLRDHGQAHYLDHDAGMGMDSVKTPMKSCQGSAKVFDSSKSLVKVENGLEEKNRWTKGCGTVPLMIVLGDALHNFGDGLAIGAAFTISISAGLSTTIAMFCHELPHELGDLAVLLSQGMRLSTAVFWNFLSALTCIVGLWVGIPLAQHQNAAAWIFAATAGTFFYVGLVHMLPMLHSYNGKNKGLIFFLQNVGFLLGMGIILVIALYEDAINVSI